MQVPQLMGAVKHAAGQWAEPTVSQVQLLQNVAQAWPSIRAQPILDRVEIQHYLTNLYTVSIVSLYAHYC